MTSNSVCVRTRLYTCRASLGKYITNCVDFVLTHIFIILRFMLVHLLCFFSVRLCRFCVAIFFFYPRHNSQWPPTLKDFYPKFYPRHFCPILILEKEPVFPFLMFSAKQGNYWYHFYNSLVWLGAWLGIEPVTSCTRSYEGSSTMLVYNLRWFYELLC